jgi:hypothetical protein
MKRKRIVIQAEAPKVLAESSAVTHPGNIPATAAESSAMKDNAETAATAPMPDGIAWVEKIKKYRAEFKDGTRTLHVGFFADLEAAVSQRVDEMRRYFGK